MEQPPKFELFVQLHLEVLDNNKNIRYTTSESFQILVGSTKSEFSIKIPKDPNFKYYNISYDLIYHPDELDFLKTGYVSKEGTSPFEYMKEDIDIRESLDVDVLSYSLFDPFSDDYNYSGFGDILASNHTGENKSFRAGAILRGRPKIVNGNLYVSIYNDGVYRASIDDFSEIFQEKVSNHPYISFIIVGERYVYFLDYNYNLVEFENQHHP